MNELQIFNHDEFGKVRTVQVNNEPWFVGKDVAEALGYSNPQKAIRDHVKESHKLTERIVTSGQNRDVTVIDEAGLYSLIMRAKTEKAEMFQEWVTSEVLPSIRKTGSYTVVKESSVVEKGEFLLKCAENAKTDNWKQLLVRGAANMVAGYELLPPLEVPKTYSAGEVGKMLGISANMVGRIAKKNGLKTSEYGVWCHDIARNGQKEVEIFRYNENGIEAIGEAIHNL